MASRVRITKEALATTIVVRRRARAGAAPFGWEVHGADTAEPLHVSPDRFTSMEAAYSAGQARLAEFIPTRSYSAEAIENHRWELRQIMADAEDDTAFLPTGSDARDHSEESVRAGA